MPNLGEVRFPVSRPVHARLLAIQERLKDEKGRQVTLTETLEILLDRAGEREEQGA